MNLFEYEGKILLKKYGINVPSGRLSQEEKNVNYPVVLKAQVLTGGRGKAGGIQIVSNEDEMKSYRETISQMVIKDEPVREVYFEETVDFNREIYFSILLDRDRKCPIIIACNHGGVDIESVPKEDILVHPIHPLLGLQEYIIKQFSHFLDIEYQEFKAFITGLWEMFISEQADLVEINPLFVNEAGMLTAGDAKVTLADSEESEKNLLIDRDERDFGSRCKALNAAGVEIGGDIAIVASGAGLGMATLDIIRHKGESVNSLVDLQGHVIHNLEDAKTLISEMKKLKPKAYLFNFYFQLASCKVLAEAIASELSSASEPIVVRMKGLDLEEAKDKVKSYSNIVVEENLEKACDTLISLRSGS